MKKYKPLFEGDTNYRIEAEKARYKELAKNGPAKVNKKLKAVVEQIDAYLMFSPTSYNKTEFERLSKYLKKYAERINQLGDNLEQRAKTLHSEGFWEDAKC